MTFDYRMLNITKKTAIVLFQLGGPDSLDAIEPFLYNLFMDPDIIDFPFAFLARRPLAKFISSKRSIKVRKNYKQIGGKSPILDLTRYQAKALEAILTAQGIHTEIFIAMRYWHPMTDAVVRDIKEGRFEQAILLPLYPHYSQATTRSSINEWNRQVRKQDLSISTQLICCYPNHPKLIEAFTDNINQALIKFRGIEHNEIDLVFSAHGVLLSYIKKGDPYQLQIEETVLQVIGYGKWNMPHTLCYQSKVGPMKWLKPSLIETVNRLAQAERKHLLIIPIAFVTDHIETLHEINIEARKHAHERGIRQFEMMPALNDHPKLIECLADLVKIQMESDIPRDTCSKLWNGKKNRPNPALCPSMN